MPKGHGHSVLVFSLVLCVQRFLWLLWIFIGTANTLYVIKVFERLPSKLFVHAVFYRVKVKVEKRVLHFTFDICYAF